VQLLLEVWVATVLVAMVLVLVIIVVRGSHSSTRTE
jgi:hypothetical protein